MILLILTKFCYFSIYKYDPANRYEGQKVANSEKVFDLDKMLAQELLSDLVVRPQYRS
jgi:hypothetical protein